MSNPYTKEDVFKERVLEILDALALQYPSLSVHVDLVRPAVVSMTNADYPDVIVEKWVKLAEHVPAFYLETLEKWFQQDVGIVRQNTSYVILPAGYDLEPDDHIILNGEPWMVIRAAEQMGVSKVQVDRPKSRYKGVPKTEPTYRQTSMKARIE